MMGLWQNGSPSNQNVFCTALVLIYSLISVCSSQRNISSCEKSSCYPATGNLLIGRENRLWASSTCGLHQRERYCIVSHLDDEKKCFWCDSTPQMANNPTYSHRIENIVYKYSPGTKQRKWWQSENGVENVTIRFDLEAEFHFTHLIMKFKTFRPAAMLIERSFDFGRTWQVYRYFAEDCETAFPGIKRDTPRTLKDVVCDSRYSSVPPSSDGEVILRVLPPNLHHLYNDPYSQEVQNLLKMTNLRFNFTKLHTLGDDLLDNRQEIKEKYYYAISEMVVRGSCSCYGHASHCKPQNGVESKPNMVHGQCQCMHNTKGLNCEQCEDFYNDLPWRPAIGKMTNACKQCNCNNHATSCHYDAAVFELTGHISGGVCDNCQHNTMGRNCEQCRPYFYHHPDRDFSDPDVCEPCDCDQDGSLDDAICDSRTDVANGLESGRCHCKTNVDGRRCDTCKNGFWNFTASNPDGCQACTCNTLGTIGNQGCDKLTGDCTCKRFVLGRDCNQCMLGFWGLGETPEGCKPCDCDIGGAYDNACDVITGQCQCRPHLTGRRCDTPEQGFFAGNLDFMVYEAENANCTHNCGVVIREPYRDRNSSWTGPGFMRVFDGTGLEFTIDRVPNSLEYDIVIRYEPQYPGAWGDVDVVIERPEPIDPNGPCGNTQPSDDRKGAVLYSNSRHAVVYPPTCLEAGKTYKVKLYFNKQANETDYPQASILIDSITLIPQIDRMPFFQAPEAHDKKEEYERYRCGEVFYTVLKGTIPEICKSYYYSIGYYVHQGAYSCECDPTGSVSALCSSLGGSCQCKDNVVGRRCDKCAPGTFGFGPEGCKACDCHTVGALDNFCDPVTGQCKCRTATYGRQCDQCQPGYWNYPDCRRCECNGYADTCDSRTGICQNCRDFTYGVDCGSCAPGYYGDPRLGIAIPCRPCPCPGTVDSGHSYADLCELDRSTNDVVCKCAQGYAGSRCDVCADNYYGNPDVPGGSCRLCDCSSNIDITKPGNCDVRTGKCLRCLYDTAGFNCEVCKDGYYGNATEHNCRECVCEVLGTDQSGGPCNGVTGQCPCLPNVVGLTCDQCEINHWKIASGFGCEPCACDPVGSTEDQCNMFDGQCKCKPGFGGRQCNQCQTNFWGDPNVQCQPCNCNPDGSATMQCHQNNGSCICILGVGGEKCDECARGFLGTAPNCSPCGECFDSWDGILTDLQQQTNSIIKAATEIRHVGATGAYTPEFEAMEKKIDDIRVMLANTSKSAVDLQRLQDLVSQIRLTLMSSDGLNGVNKQLEDTAQKIITSNFELDNIRNKTADLKKIAEQFRDNSTQLQESNVEGALNLTKQAEERARIARDKVGTIIQLTDDVERRCKQTEALIQRTTSQFTQDQNRNTENIKILDNEIRDLEDKIPNLNLQICGKLGDPCDQLCGGAMCGTCGGISCEGSVEKAGKAYDFAQEAEKAIREKQGKAEETFRGVSSARQEAWVAKNLTMATLEKSELVHNKSMDILDSSSILAQKIEEFLTPQSATPSQIRVVANSTLNKNIQLKPEQITDLAKQINETVASITDIHSILSETANDLGRADKLKQEADSAKNKAEVTLKTAEKVTEALNEAEIAQEKANQAIREANNNITVAKKDLTLIGNETDEAETKAEETVKEVEILQERLKALQTKFLENGRDAKNVELEASAVEIEVETARNKTVKLQEEHKKAEHRLKNRVSSSATARNKATELHRKASQLYVNTNSKLKELLEAEKSLFEQEQMLIDLSKEVDTLNVRISESLSVIGSQSEYYRNCN
nr:PREDICTED: laminin subunit beta-1 [Bemisia tabaci]